MFKDPFSVWESSLNVHFLHLPSEMTQSKEDSIQTCQLAPGHAALLLIFVYFASFSPRGKELSGFCYTLV